VDELLSGGWEYYITFENGATATVYFTERRGRFVEAAIFTYPPPGARQPT